MNSELLKKNEVGCNLFVDTNNCHPEIVTQKTGVVYSDIVVKGEPFKTATGKIINKKLNKLNLWILKMPKIQSTESETKLIIKSIERTLELLDRNKEKFVSVFSDFPCNHIKCYAYLSEETNSTFYLDTDMISRLAEYGLSIEFDLYFNGGQ